jgi:hypothetical protein
MNENIKRIQEASGRILPNTGKLQPFNPFQRQNGEVWITHGIHKGSETETLRVLLLEVAHESINGQSFHLAAPILTETHLAGPTDFLLPQHILGHRAMIALGEAFTITGQSLDSCHGLLPHKVYEAVIRSFAVLEKGGSLTQNMTGPEYLDEDDIRYRFHAELAARLGPLQAEALSLLDAGESNTASIPLIYFPPQSADEPGELRMAASTASQKALYSETWVSMSPAIRLSISECRDRSRVAIEVLEGERDAEGIRVLGKSGEELGRITQGAASVLAPIAGGWFELPDGTRLLLSKEPKQP